MSELEGCCCCCLDAFSNVGTASSSGYGNNDEETYTTPKSYRMLRTEFKNAKELIHSANYLERVGETPENGLRNPTR